MAGLKVAGRYAQSLIELSDELKVTDAVLNDMEQLLATTNENKDFHVFLNSPLIKSDKKNDIFGKLFGDFQRSEEHTSELQSRPHLVCRLLLEKKKKKKKKKKNIK